MYSTVKVSILTAVLVVGDILPMQAGAMPTFWHLFEDAGSGDGDQPLMLSPLVEQSRLEEARTMSRVRGGHVGMPLDSYSGFFTAKSAQSEAHLFFWFFPALTNPQTAPVILWMNGGPGLSSLSGLFAEIGPYYISNEGRVNAASVTWLSKFSLIFLDVPAGTGFSLPKSSTAYANTTQGIAKEVHEVLDQFFLVFPEYSHPDFYVAGESYGAKYAIALASILKATSPASPVNLKGLILVSGAVDLENNMQSADYLYQTGLVQDQVHDQLAQAIRTVAQYVNAGQYALASQIIGGIVGDHYRPGFFTNESGIRGSNNILRDAPLSKFSTFVPYVNGSQSVRRALHTGSATDNPFVESQNEVLLAFVANGDFAQSWRPQLQDLLDADLKVLYVTGNVDYLITPYGAKKFVEALQWKYRDRFLNETQRVIWRVNADDVDSAGYVKCAGSFCWALVRNAGHRLPGDEPIRALDIVDRFINNRPF